MTNPFEVLENRLSNIEALLLEIKNCPPQPSIADSNQPQFLYSLQELATFLGCSIVTAQKLKNSGRIPFKQFGRKLIFNSSDVLQALNKERRIKNGK